MYDLPATFNAKILANYDGLNPWTSRCDSLENGGLGLVATGLARIMLENLAPTWYWTNQFVLEIIFHNGLLKHKCWIMESKSSEERNWVKGLVKRERS